MAETEAMEPEDSRLDELLEGSGLAWPVGDRELDAWLADYPLPPDEEAWLRDVIQRRVAEAARVPESLRPGASIGAPVGAEAESPAIVAKTVRQRRPRPLSYEDLALLNGELLELVEANVSLPTGLTTYASELRGGNLEEVLEDLRRDLEDGRPLSESLQRRGQAFPPIYRALVAAGEASGDLTGCLSLLHEQAQVDAEFQRRIRETLAYPAVTFAAALVGLVLMAVFLAPRFEELWVDMGIQLPLYTRIVMGTLGFLGDHLLLSVGLLVGLGFALRRTARVHLPRLVSRILEGRSAHRGLAELSRALAGFLERGLPLTDAMRTLADGQVRFEPTVLRNVLQRLEGGQGLAASLRAERAFPPTYVWMVGAAEQRGDLAGALRSLAERHERSFRQRLQMIESVVGPIALGVVGVLVGAGALSIYLPLFTLQQALQQ